MNRKKKLKPQGAIFRDDRGQVFPDKPSFFSNIFFPPSITDPKTNNQSTDHGPFPDEEDYQGCGRGGPGVLQEYGGQVWDLCGGGLYAMESFPAEARRIGQRSQETHAFCDVLDEHPIDDP